MEAKIVNKLHRMVKHTLKTWCYEDAGRIIEIRDDFRKTIAEFNSKYATESEFADILNISVEEENGCCKLCVDIGIRVKQPDDADVLECQFTYTLAPSIEAKAWGTTK